MEAATSLAHACHTLLQLLEASELATTTVPGSGESLLFPGMTALRAIQAGCGGGFYRKKACSSRPLTGLANMQCCGAPLALAADWRPNA